VEYFFGISKIKGNSGKKEFEGDENEMEIESDSKIRDKWFFVFPLCLFSFCTAFRGRAQRSGF
jgi:hypothetical protein